MCVAVRVAVRVAKRATRGWRKSCAVVMQRVAVCVAVCCGVCCSVQQEGSASLSRSRHTVCCAGVSVVLQCVAVCCADKGQVLKKTQRRGNDETEAKQTLAIRHYNGTILIQILRIPHSALMPRTSFPSPVLTEILLLPVRLYSPHNQCPTVAPVTHPARQLVVANRQSRVGEQNLNNPWRRLCPQIAVYPDPAYE